MNFKTDRWNRREKIHCEVQFYCHCVDEKKNIYICIIKKELTTTEKYQNKNSFGLVKVKLTLIKSLKQLFYKK